MPDERRHWTLTEEVTFLNHGSFGACPRSVLAKQQELRAEMEAQPVEFFVRRLPSLFDDARKRLGAFLGARPENLVTVTNATAGVNTVLRSLVFQAGDELLTTNHAYNACRNGLDFVAQRAGAKVVVVAIPFPGTTSEGVRQQVLEAVTARTRLVLLDHITSPTGLVFPVAELVAELALRGVDTLVDGAHGPGMVELSLEELGAAYYTGNCHKWLCAPKGAAFLYVRPDRQEGIVPLSISHGANQPRPGRSRFHDLFDWTGTDDPTPFLCVPTALDFLDTLLPGGLPGGLSGGLLGGWPELRRRNRELALAGREILCQALGCEAPCPEEMIGSLAAVPLPDGSPEPPASALYSDPLQGALLEGFGVEVPIVPWPAPPKRLVRISAQIYNQREDYLRLAEALRRSL